MGTLSIDLRGVELYTNFSTFRSRNRMAKKNLIVDDDLDALRLWD